MPFVSGLADIDVQIPFFTQSVTFERLWPLISRHVDEIGRRGKYSHGPKVAEFEQALARYTGARFVIGVNSGTDALVLLLRAAGLEPGDEVVVPAYGFVASASSVVLAGGRPVFADIDRRSYALDPAAADAAVTPRCRFILPAHMFAQVADMGGILRVAARHGLTVLEDSAEAIGMRWAGVHAGLLGAGGVLSFFPTKTLGAIGDAGAVLTDDERIAETVGALRHHGRFGRTLDHFPGIANPTELSGVNSKMDDIQAAVLLAKLTCLDADIETRARLAAGYTERLSGLAGIVRLPAAVDRPVVTTGVCYVYLVEVARRAELAEYLARRGIGTESYYPMPLPRQPCFAHLGYSGGEFPNAEAACRRALALPLYPDLGMAGVDRVCAAIRAFCAASGGGG